MKKSVLSKIVFSVMIFTLVMSAKIQAEEWNKKDVKILTKGAFTYEAYTSKKGKQCWIYKVKIDKKKNTATLKFPKKINGFKVTKIGSKVYKNSDFCYNVFGNFVEWYHGGDGYTKNMKGIKKVVVPNSVHTITRYSFAGLKNLTKVTLPDNLKTIDLMVFHKCKKLTKITIPKSTKKVSVYAFEKCKNLEKFKVNKKNKTFSAEGGMLLSKKKDKLYYVAPKLTKVIIPDTVTAIGEQAFNYSRAKEVVIPKSVSKIENNALTTTAIKTIDLSESNETYAKDGKCIYNKKTKELAVVVNQETSLIVSNKVEIIPNTVSLAGKKVKYMELPSGLKKLELFWHNLTTDMQAEVKFNAVTPPELVSDRPGYVYSRYPLYSTIIVPKQGEKAYKDWVTKNDGEDFVEIKTY